jgi:hypothetical protein
VLQHAVLAVAGLQQLAGCLELHPSTHGFGPAALCVRMQLEELLLADVEYVALERQGIEELKARQRRALQALHGQADSRLQQLQAGV